MKTVCPSALHAAEYAIGLEGFAPMTNLRLQKLLYFLQGFSFQRFDLPLFPDRLEAWTYGPYVDSVYGNFMGYGKGVIPRWMGTATLFSSLPHAEVEEFFRKVLTWAEKHSTKDLVAMSMAKSTPWEITWRNGEGKYDPVPLELLRKFFRNA